MGPRDLQRAVDAGLDLTDSEAALLAENVGVADGARRADVDYAFLLLLLAEPLPRHAQALSAGAVITKKLKTDAASSRRLAAALFRAFAASDPHRTGLVPVDVAERAVRDEVRVDPPGHSI